MPRLLILFAVILSLQGCNNGKRERDIALFTNGFLNGYILMQENCINKAYPTAEQVDSIAIIEANKILDKIYK